MSGSNRRTSSEQSDDASRAAQRRQRRDRGLLGELVKIVLGGLAGLVAGYYLLNWIGGPHYNFLHLPLPGLPAAVAPETAAVPPPAPAVEEPAETPAATPAIPPAGAIPAAPTTPAPAATPAETFPPDYIGPRQRPVVTSDELGRALAEAHAALGCLRCNSTGMVSEVVVTNVREVAGRTIESKSRQRRPCPDCQGDPAYRLSADAYPAWCHLAELVAFGGSAVSSETNRMAAIRDLLVQSADSAEEIEAVGRMAERAIEAQLAAPASHMAGVLLAGRVLKMGTAGKLRTARLALAGSGRELTLLGDRTLPLGPGGQALVLAGAIVQPRENLIGYEGDEPLVLWYGLGVMAP